MFNTLGNSISRSGLVGEWLFDGNALDTSGVGNDLTATNIVYEKTNRGYQSQCARFNGTSSVASDTSANFSVTTTYSMAWTWDSSTLPTSGNLYNFFIKGNNTTATNGFDCVLYNNAGTYQIIMTHSGPVSGTSYTWNITTPTVNTRYFYEIKYGSNVISLYINGVLISSQAATTAPTYANNNFYVGYNGIAGIRRFNGTIQLLRIYDRVLSQDESQILYLESLRKLGPTNIAKYPALLSGLVGYWDFRGSAHNLVDGSLATITGATLTTDRFGNSNSAYSFNGSSNYINISSSTISTLINGRNPFNIEMIVKFNNFTGTPILIDGRDTDYNGAWIECSTGGILKFIRSDGSVADTTCQSTSALSTGVWYHIVVTYDGTTAKLYQNGVKQTDGTSTRTLNSATNINLGSGLAGGTRFAYLNGIIDICCIYQINVKTQDEVSTLYNLTSQDYIYPTPSYDLASLRDGLILDLNEQGYDLSGQGNNGTLVNSPTVVRQGRAKGLSYNGSNQSIVTGNVNLFGGSNNFTVAMWIKPGSSQVAYADICDYDHNNATATNRGFVIQQNNTTLNQYSMTVMGTGTPGDGGVFTTLTSNVRQSFILVKNGNTITHYVNGVQTGTGTQAVTLNNPTVPFKISGLQTGGGRFFNGQIISPKIWNRVLSDKEIQALYYSQKGNFIY